MSDKKYVRIVVDGKENININMEKRFLQMASILNTLEHKGMNNIDNMPMLSIPFLDWLNSYDFSNHFMVEFGSGNSTNYFADRFKKVLSYETDQSWFDKISSSAKENVECRLISKEDILSGNYDIFSEDNLVVFMDMNINRKNAMETLLKQHAPDMIILDNSEWDPNNCKIIQDKGYMQIPFWGIRFEEYYDKCTFVFLKQGYRLPYTNHKYFVPGAYVVNSDIS
jgi:hypothetical protein